MKLASLALLLFSPIAFSSQLSIQMSGQPGHTAEVLNSSRIKKKIKNPEFFYRSLPQFIPEGAPPSKEIFFEELVDEMNNAQLHIQNNISAQKLGRNKFVGNEIRTLVESGPAANRIVLTFVGDGYTEQEKERFFEDVKFLVDDMFSGSTFASYINLFNVYAIFVPSQDSGITDGSNRKNTAFSLYRSPAGSKRAIMPGQPGRIRQALSLIGHKTDYPVVVANDDYYGGLGGEFAITTRSRLSGPMVLRHELGHNFGNVGEEYDGGYVYSGANNASSSTSWNKWISSNDNNLHESQYLSGSYVWQKLYDRAFSKKFSIKNNRSESYRYELQLSSVGWSGADEVSVKVDGRDLQIEGVFSDDRSFFVVDLGELDASTHILSIEDKSFDGDNVLAFANVYAYGTTYVNAPDHVAAYATYNSYGSRDGYRPTHDSCLMRNMRVKHFCVVDIENMWKRFLARVSLIDGATKRSDGNEYSVNTVDLDLTYKWYEKINGQWSSVAEGRNLRSIVLNTTNQVKVDVLFVTDEVRSPTSDFSDSHLFN